MMRRRRRRRNHWIWADRFGMPVIQDVGAAAVSSHVLLPPSRVNWLCGTAAFKAGLTVSGVLLWLDWAWQNRTQTATAGQSLPDVDFFVMTCVGDEANNFLGSVYDPYVQPEPPSLTSDWISFPSDGLDPFLWTHHMRGLSPPNANVSTYQNQSSPGPNHPVFPLNNQSNIITAAGSSDGTQATWMCRTFSHRQEWQPDVVIRAKRRLKSNQGLMIGFRFPGTSTLVFGSMSVNVRLLAH